MASNEETLQELLDETNKQLLDAIKNPSPSYTLGPRKFDWNQWLQWLRQQKKDLLDEMSSIPAAETNVYCDDDIDCCELE